LLKIRTKTQKIWKWRIIKRRSQYMSKIKTAIFILGAIWLDLCEKRSNIIQIWGATLRLWDFFARKYNLA
jgi:hypothetical protein